MDTEYNNIETTILTMSLSEPGTMYVTKRTGEREEVSFDKITKRIKKLSSGLCINPMELAQTIISQIYDGISTMEIDELSAEVCAGRMTVHPDYCTLAKRIIISNHHKNTSPSFSEVIQMLWDNVDIHNKHTPIINEQLYAMTMENKAKINSVIDYDNDYNFDYFGFKTLERAYLLKINGKVIERPQHMIMRVCLGIHKDDIKEAIKSYKMISEGYFTHATPTLFNVGTQKEQAFSCFLLQIQEDSIRGIYKTLTDCALISQCAGGIGIAAHKVRSKGSSIRGTGGVSNGIVPMLKNFNETARYVDQGGNKRKGSIAIYLEPWHADINDFLHLRRNTGAETERARDLFYAMWIPDLFMERVRDNKDWTLMCPDACPGLHTTYGDEFKELYEKYERDGRGIKTIKAQKLWQTIIDSQIETGTPYIGYKDHINKKNNQKNLGVIQSSNLCIEIVEYTSPEEHAVCCLLSVALPKYLEPVELKGVVKVYSKTDCKYCTAAKNLLLRLGIKYEEINLDDDTKRKETITELNKKELECSEGVCKVEGGIITTVPQIYIDEKRIGGYKELLEVLKPRYNFDKLREATKMAVRNLNKLIDYNYYPVPETETSNRRHRPIGIGVQGLADTFLQLRMAFDSDEAIEMSRKIAETMYLAACQASMDIARKRKKYVQDYRRLLKKKEQTPLEFTPEDKDKLVELETKYFIYKDEVEKLPMSLAGAYSSFVGSPASEGKLQFDLWDVKPSPELEEEWAQLKDDIKKHGLRNSLLMASMPTASTSQILGNNECFEPYTNNIYTRQTLAGIFTIVNKYLIQDCIDLGIWTPELKDKIILANGSVQHIEEIPKFVRDLYKVVWEIKQKWLVDHAVARAPFICQTQSMNIFMKDPTPNKLNKLHFYAWNKGLKTGIYYLRTLAKSQSSKFSIDMGKYNNKKPINEKETDKEECLSCSA